MRIDGHIHGGFALQSREEIVQGSRKLMADLNSAGIGGAIILSDAPFRAEGVTVEKRMQATLDFCSGSETLFPFYWINPLDEDALAQVDRAVELGYDGFKMICVNYYPGCKESMDVLQRISEKNKPVLFHSGILWNDGPSANYNRPGNFEALLEIPKLRFALAHISWPWCDECIAVYGKFIQATRSRSDACEMFIDVTPGTPRAYRDEVYKHLLCTGYDIKNNIFFGTDSGAANYNVEGSKGWQEYDDSLYEKYLDCDVEDFKQHVYYNNVMRFMGKEL